MAEKPPYAPNRNKRGQFVKGHIPWHKGLKGVKPATLGSFKKGQHVSKSTEFKKGMKTRMGIKHTEETKRKISINRRGKPAWNDGIKFSQISGDKHWNWRGGVTPLNMVVRKSLETELWRKFILNRDDYTCQICGQRGGELRANHIRRFADYPDLRFERSNGITICCDCDNRWVINHEPEWESYFNFNLMTREEIWL